MAPLPQTYTRSGIRWLVAVALLVAATAAAAPAASSNVVVSMTVASQTSITPGTCVTGSSGITRFGTIQPSQSFVAADCTIGFGSSNDSSKLLLSQSDLTGDAMFRFGDGELHLPFGGGGTGIVSHEPGGADYADDLASQTTGHFVTAGYSTPAGDRVVTISRFTSNGVLDTTFGTDAGYSHFQLGADEALNAVAVLDDDSILAVGSTNNGGATGIDAVIIKVTANGQPYPGFGVGGVLEWHVSGTDTVEAVHILPDGSFLAAGEIGTDMAIWKFNADGTPYTTFGVNGVRLVNLGTDDKASGIAVATDGMIYVAGNSRNGSYQWTLVRLDPAGTVLSTTITAIGTGNSYAYRPHVMSTGEVLVRGISATVAGGTDFTVAKYSALGAIDTTWATNGVITRSMAPAAAGDAPLGGMLLPDDRLLLVGNADFGSNRWTAARLLPSGTWDQTFGSNGTLTWLTHNGSASGVVLGPDGRVVVAGSGFGGITLSMLDSTTVANYADAALPGDTDWSTGANTFGACLRATSGANVVATWGTTGSCAVDDDDPWMAIPETIGSATAEVARTNLAGTNGSATLRFGIRAATTQRPGTYFAPIDVTVVAPG